MSVNIKKIVIYRGEVDNVPGQLAKTLEPLKAMSLKVLMGYRIHGVAGKQVVEAYPVSGNKATAAAAAAGLAPSSLPALLVEGEDRPGLGHAIALSMGSATINMQFVVALATGKKFQAVFGFESDSDAAKAVGVIKAAAKGLKKDKKDKKEKKGKKKNKKK